MGPYVHAVGPICTCRGTHMYTVLRVPYGHMYTVLRVPYGHMDHGYPWVGPWQYQTGSTPGYTHPVPTTPGYTTAPVHVSAGSAWDPSAQRLDLSVKTAVSGSPTYRTLILTFLGPVLGPVLGNLTKPCSIRKVGTFWLWAGND